MKFQFQVKLHYPVLNSPKTVDAVFWVEEESLGAARAHIEKFAKQYQAEEISMLETTRTILTIKE